MHQQLCPPSVLWCPFPQSASLSLEPPLCPTLISFITVNNIESKFLVHRNDAKSTAETGPAVWQAAPQDAWKLKNVKKLSWHWSYAVLNSKHLASIFPWHFCNSSGPVVPPNLTLSVFGSVMLSTILQHTLIVFNETFKSDNIGSLPPLLSESPHPPQPQVEIFEWVALSSSSSSRPCARSTRRGWWSQAQPLHQVQQSLEHSQCPGVVLPARMWYFYE